MSPRRPLVVLGIGNLLLSDDGVGVRVIEALEDVALPGDVELVDGGTAGADLIEVVADRQKVIVIDAMETGGPPGTVLRVPGADLCAEDTQLSLHEVGLVDALHMARRLGCEPGEVVVFGVQPERLELTLELSETVSGAIPDIVRRVREELAGESP